MNIKTFSERQYGTSRLANDLIRVRPGQAVEHAERWGRWSFVGRRPSATLIAKGPHVTVEGQVLGTPTLFIDGVVHRGGYDPSALLAALGAKAMIRTRGAR